MKEEINKLFTINGKPLRTVISQYVDRGDTGGLSALFNAFLDDLILATSNQEEI